MLSFEREETLSFFRGGEHCLSLEGGKCCFFWGGGGIGKRGLLGVYGATSATLGPFPERETSCNGYTICNCRADRKAA